MNLGLFALNIVSGGDIKKQISIVLTSMFIILLLPFMAVFAMGEETLAFLASSPSAEHAETQGFYMGGPIPGNTYAWGNCTYWAFAMRLWNGHPIPTTWGNANTWDDRAELDGYVVNRMPMAGAVYQTDEGFYGHVAYVTAVNDKTGDWTISEMNNVGLNIVNTRTFPKESAAYYRFIHHKKGEKPWSGQITSPFSPKTGTQSSR